MRSSAYRMATRQSIKLMISLIVTRVERTILIVALTGLNSSVYSRGKRIKRSTMRAPTSRSSTVINWGKQHQPPVSWTGQSTTMTSKICFESRLTRMTMKSHRIQLEVSRNLFEKGRVFQVDSRGCHSKQTASSRGYRMHLTGKQLGKLE